MFELNRTDIKVLTAVAKGETSLQGIARSLKKSNTRISVVAKGLEEKGFLARERQGLSYKLSLSPTRFVDDIKPLLLSDAPQLDCLTDTRILLMGLLSAPVPLKKRDLMMISNISSSSVRDFLNIGVRYTVLKREGTRYRISRSMGRLRDFIVDYSASSTLKMLSSISEDCIVHWRAGFDIIYSTAAESKKAIGKETATTAFSSRGVEFVGPRSYYHYTPFQREMGLEDAVLDNILMDPSDPRAVINSMIFIKKTRKEMDQERLLWLAEIFGLSELVKEMLEFLDGQRDGIEGVINRKDFDEKYRVYE